MGTMTDPDALDAAADELYGTDPRDFIARREQLVKEARAAKDRKLADAIKALRRPTTGAWYLNLASRDRLTGLVGLLRLARELADAQERRDAARLRELGAQRSALERRVLRDLSAHLAARGVTTTPAAIEEVRTTLRAALSDPDAAEQVARGRLTRPLQYGAFGDGDLSAALAAMVGDAAGPRDEEQQAPAAEPEEAEETDDESEREARAAEEQVAAAQRALEVASAKRDLVAARRDVSRAEEALSIAAAAADEAQGRVAEYERALATARSEADAAGAAREDARAAVEEARERVAAAQRVLEG